MSHKKMRSGAVRPSRVCLRGARYAIGPNESVQGSLVFEGGRITGLWRDHEDPPETPSESIDVDMNGYLLMPGLINAHDHLQYALHPKLGHPPYRNYVQWGEDIHAASSSVVAKYKSIPREVRLWWGGIRNLLSGVTTVCHHDRLWPELHKQDFPVSVVQEYGWAHSLALGGNLHAAYAARAKGSAFLVHACEGVDDLAKGELFTLDGLGLLNADTVLIHGLAIEDEGAALLRDRGTSVIVCPSSNYFLFAALPDMNRLDGIAQISLGNDSPLTAKGDLLDEIRFAMDFCHVSADRVYRMVTEFPAKLLRLKNKEGTIQVSGAADLIAVRYDGRTAGDRLRSLSVEDVELVIVRGQVRLASERIRKQLPVKMNIGLKPLWVDGIIRWLRAPVQKLLGEAEAVVGTGEVRLGGRSVRSVDSFIATGMRQRGHRAGH
jgi:cytosine/adenosine deaminase-related metal-dependent hydrolase